MKVKRINIRNILGIQELEINAGSVTVVEGQNESGKTSVIEAVKSIFEGGHDATLLRGGAEKGEVVLLLDDGTEVKKVISADNSTLSVKHAVMGKIARPAEFIKKLSDSLSVNPVEFLSADHKTRAAYLLEALPLTVTPGDFEGVSLQPISQALCTVQHPFVTIAAVYKGLYDERTGTNRLLGDKRGSVEELSKTLPADSGEDWLAKRNEVLVLLNGAQEEHDTLVTNARRQNEAATHTITTAYQQSRDGIEKEYVASKEAIEKERAHAIAEVNAAAEKKRDELLEGYQKKVDGILAIKTSCEEQQKGIMNESETVLSEHREKVAKFKQQAAMLDQKAQEAGRITSARQLIAKYQDEAKSLEARSQDLTARLEKLEALKLRLASTLPIEGIEVKDGQIFRGGVPFDRLNTAQQIEIAVKVAAIRAKELRLVCVDGIEAFDEKRLKQFQDILEANGLQAIMTKVTSEPMSVKTI